jgi:hypothetical protein
VALSSTTKITCDYVDKDGKRCPKVFLIPDPPAKPTPGFETVLRVIDINGVEHAKSFCGWLHLVAFGAAWLKATPKDEPKKGPNPSQEQLISLAAAGVIESNFGPASPPEDLSLKDA